MADNDVVDNGANTDYTARDKDRGGVKTQIVGLDLNIGGSAESLMRQSPTYAASYRLTTGRELTSTPAANGEKQLATIYHTGTATKTLRLIKATVLILNAAAAVHQFELRRLSATTAPATGNPAITPASFDPADTVEATCLAMPTTAGSDSAANSPLSPNFPISAGAPTAPTNLLGASGLELVLFDAEMGNWQRKLPSVPSGTAGGFVIIHRATAAVALNFTAFIEFTEE